PRGFRQRLLSESQGYYLAERCKSSEEPAACKPCPSGKYSKGWNTYGYCHLCTVCNKEHGATYKKICNNTANAQCTCGKDKRWNTESSSCEPCPTGFYSDEDDNEPCTRRTSDMSLPAIKTTSTQGRRAPNSTTASSTTLLNTTRPPPSVTTEGQPALSVEVKFYISVIVVTAAIFLIFLIKRRRMYLGVKKQDSHRCFGFRQDVKSPVQEESEDMTSVQVKN
ncbi:hypothetical protein scyTo_0015642, partial [Scyliorhinus torazame]|nr:hypothetical protein [Scyliorhinus torazame]